jgi:hypothetical protein
MAWPRIEIHFRVVVGPLVEVLDEHANRCSECDIELSARLNLHSILFITLVSVEDR